MASTTYVHIQICGNQFYIVESDQKPQGGALTTLQSIETVLREGFSYDAMQEGPFSELPENRLHMMLKQTAQTIRDNYFNKTSWIPTVFTNCDKIHATHGRIVAPDLLPLHRLPPEILEQILGYLPAKDTGNFGKVIPCGATLVEKVEQRQMNGYDKEALDEQTLLKTISVLVRSGVFPMEYAQASFWEKNFKDVDSEKIHERIKNLSGDKKKDFEEKLNEKFVNFVERMETISYIDPKKFNEQSAFEMLYTYITLGANPNSRFVQTGTTALMKAAQLNNPNMVRFLLKRGADPYIQNSEGKTALSIAEDQKSYKAIEVLATHKAH